jgi:hypothetical protein
VFTVRYGLGLQLIYSFVLRGLLIFYSAASTFIYSVTVGIFATGNAW